MIKIILTVLVVGSLCYASNPASEELFIQGEAYRLQAHGQDSSKYLVMACYYFERAYKEDSTTSTLQEVYGNSLLGIKDTINAISILKKSAYSYSSEKNWLKAFAIFKNLYDLTGNYADGAMLGLMIFNQGIETKDSLWLNKAVELWEKLSNRAQAKNDLKGLSQIQKIRSSVQK